MSQVLSQEEVDVLLNGLSDGEIDTTTEEIEDPSGIRRYDLTNQDRIARGRMPTLEMATERFNRLFRTTLLMLLRRNVGVNVLSVGMVKYGEFINQTPLPASLNVFTMKPLRGKALLVFEAQIVFTIIDIMFGGSGQSSYKVEGRDFTHIENNIVKKLAQSTLKDFETVWQIIKKVKIDYVKSETNPQFAQVAMPSDVVVVIKLEVDMDFTTGKINFCIPYSTVEPVSKKLQAGYQAEALDVDQKWGKRIMKGLQNSQLNLKVNLGQTELRGKEIVNLKKGDVIPLDQYCNEGLNVYVEDIPKFKGHPGIYRSNQAVLIAKLIAGAEEE